MDKSALDTDRSSHTRHGQDKSTVSPGTDKSSHIRHGQIHGHTRHGQDKSTVTLDTDKSRHTRHGQIHSHTRHGQIQSHQARTNPHQAGTDKSTVTLDTDKSSHTRHGQIHSCTRHGQIYSYQARTRQIHSLTKQGQIHNVRLADKSTGCQSDTVVSLSAAVRLRETNNRVRHNKSQPVLYTDSGPWSNLQEQWEREAGTSANQRRCWMHAGNQHREQCLVPKRVSDIVVCQV